MKYTHLEEIPVKERQKMLLPDWNMKYFKGAYLVFPILVLLVALINTVFLIYYKEVAVVIFLCNVIGITAALLSHLAISSGFISCNIGSYFKAKEPIRFWLTTGSLMVGFIFCQVGMWYY